MQVLFILALGVSLLACEPKPSRFEPEGAAGCLGSGDCALDPEGAAMTPESCAASELCPIAGLCEAERGRCIGTASSCRASEICRLSGACVPRRGGCEVVRAIDCASSKGCLEVGLCGLVEADGMAHCAPTDDRHCASSERCHRSGACALSIRLKGACGVPDDSACERSRACADAGRCRRVDTGAMTPEAARVAIAEGKLSPFEDGTACGHAQPGQDPSLAH